MTRTQRNDAGGIAHRLTAALLAGSAGPSKHAGRSPCVRAGVLGDGDDAWVFCDEAMGEAEQAAVLPAPTHDDNGNRDGAGAARAARATPPSPRSTLSYEAISPSCSWQDGLNEAAAPGASSAVDTSHLLARFFSPSGAAVPPSTDAASSDAAVFLGPPSATSVHEAQGEGSELNLQLALAPAASGEPGHSCVRVVMSKDDDSAQPAGGDVTMADAYAGAEQEGRISEALVGGLPVSLGQGPRRARRRETSFVCVLGRYLMCSKDFACSSKNSNAPPQPIDLNLPSRSPAGHPVPRPRVTRHQQQQRRRLLELCGERLQRAAPRVA
jgi:hypothetical protein